MAKDLQNTLERLGYTVSAIASTGEEAITKAAETKPDLVLMDINLRGGIDGVDAAGEIRSRLNIPTVYLTAHTDSETLRRAKSTEPLGYIVKPFEGREIDATIEMAIHRSEIDEELRQSRQRFDAALRGVGDAVITTDTHGSTTFVNPVASALTGWGNKQASGSHLTEIFRILNGESNDVVENPATRAMGEGVVSLETSKPTFPRSAAWERRNPVRVLPI